MSLDHRARPPSLATLALLGLLAAASANASAATRATSALLERMTLETRDSSIALALTLSRAVHPHLRRLHAPERLVIDLPNTRRSTPLPRPAGIVVGLRSGTSSRALRIVLELSAAAEPRLVTLGVAGGERLRIELGAQVATHELARTAFPASVHAIRAAHAPEGAHEVIVAVDAGHGGMDPGATGTGGTHEKDVTLAIARALAERINHEPGMRAVLTRDGDYFIALRDRITRASAAHAEMFVSIHADAVRDRAVNGASVYILSDRGASSEEARVLADEQNAADLMGGIALADQPQSLRPLLLDIAQSANIGESVEAADRVLHALDGVGAVRRRAVERAAFVVLKSPAIPSMLIETAYISNPAEERRLRSFSEQQRLAQAIFGGVAGYFRDHPPDGSRFARSAAHGSVPSQGG